MQIKINLEKVSLGNNGAGMMGSQAGWQDFLGKAASRLPDGRFPDGRLDGRGFKTINEQQKYWDLKTVEKRLSTKRDYIKESLKAINKIDGKTLNGQIDSGFDIYYELKGKNNEIIGVVSKGRQLELRDGAAISYWMVFDASVPQQTRLEFTNKMVSKLEAKEPRNPTGITHRDVLAKNWINNFEATKKEVINEMFPSNQN